MLKLFTNVGGRRFILTCTTQVISSFLLWFNHLTSEAYSMIILGTVAVYIGSGTYQKVKGALDA
jgi:hypothetical protein